MKNAHLLLYCKDNPLCRLMKEMCEEWGFELSWINDLDKVLQTIKEKPIELIIIATNLKSYSLEEWDLARTLRKMGCRLPIIAISDHAMPGDALRAYQCGIDELLVKPIEVDSILLYIESHLKNTGKNNFMRRIPRKEQVLEYRAG